MIRIAALENAHGGAVAEGNVGGGTGMICHEFKGVTGASSRRFRVDDAEYTVGVPPRQDSCRVS